MTRECMKAELDLFTPLPMQSNILDTYEVVYKPIASLDNPSTIEFALLSRGDTYRDLSSVQLRLRVKLLKNEKGDPIDNASNIGVVNNLLHSLFRQCTVYLNGKAVSQSDINYHYRSYIETILNYGNDAASTHLESVGWIMDKGNFESLEAGKNSGLDDRKALFKNSEEVELVGRLHSDIFNQNKLLLNNVDVRVVLSLEKPEFYIMEANTGSGNIKILDASLHMNEVKINPNILIAHRNVLERQNAIYPYKRVEVKSFTIPKGNFNLSLDNVVLGVLPNVLIFTMVDNSSYTGHRSGNPFNFTAHKLSSFNLVVNGVQIPNQPIELNYTKPNSIISTRAYNTLFKGTGIHYFDKGHQITKKLFDKGCFMLAFDLTADRSSTSMCDNLLSDGNIRIEGRFSEPLSSTITCLVYCEFNAVMEINNNRNVFTNF